MNEPDSWSLTAHLLALSVPTVLTLTALIHPRAAIRATVYTVSITVLISLGLLSGVVVTQGATTPSLAGVRLDLVTCVMLGLVCSIGAAVSRYSRTYLDGEPRLDSYFRWLLLTLSAVTVLVIAGNLLVIAAAWTATSLALHKLLVFYPDRTPALVVAHKKFLLSRLADVCFWSGLVLIHLAVGSLELSTIAVWVGAHPDLTPAVQAAAVLVVIAVALKSAQLPFHGWLTQVMEAPTPVSALLHAGIVNIGGFLMIRLSPLMAQAAIAQTLLVGTGLVTAVLAALVMTTRVSVKVALAWSTCAQMGFMLVQCGLGAWHLALLHLVAHSFYKAHAFLRAGSVVDQWRVRQLRRPTPQPSAGRVVATTLVVLGGAGAGLVGLSVTDVSVWVLAMLVALSVVPMVARRTVVGGPLSTVLGFAGAAGLASLYALWHMVAGVVLPEAAVDSSTVVWRWALVGLGIVVLFGMKAILSLRPHGALAEALYQRLFAGLYLDERFTRLTFRIWPPRLVRPTPADSVRVGDTLGARV